MPAEWTVIGAFLVGLLGSVHCIGMCGGIAGLLAANVQARSSAGRIAVLLAYNSGRIGSYLLAGAIAGGLGGTLFAWLGPRTANAVAGIISALFLLALGAYLAGWWSYLQVLERFGARFWRRIEPWGRRLLPVRGTPQALLLGALWGWLPCGMVYTVLVWSMASGSAANGALLMLGFGLGTLPTLMALGGMGAWLRRVRHSGWVRGAAAVFVFTLGVYGLFASVLGGGHAHMH